MKNIAEWIFINTLFAFLRRNTLALAGCVFLRLFYPTLLLDSFWDLYMPERRDVRRLLKFLIISFTQIAKLLFEV